MGKLIGKDISPHNIRHAIATELSLSGADILEIRDLWPETWVAMGATTKKSILYKVFAYIEKVLYKNGKI